MDSVMRTLWEATCSMEMSAETKRRMKKLLVYEDQIQAQFGLEFVQELEAAWDEVQVHELESAFARGFLTAFRLWMEAVLPPGR